MFKDINYLVLSDIHGGRANNSIDTIFSNIVSYFNKYNRQFKELDYIFINGDVYDKLLINGSYEANKVMEMLIFILDYCVKYNIGIRFLKGTPSHDWDQLDSLVLLVENHPEYSKLDFKYFKNLHIEKLDSHGINILYVPDEWRTNPMDTYKEVKELMVKQGIQQVDLCMMHGFFKYQLPSIVGNGHDEELYLNICKYYIHIGHVHTFSTYKRIVANGSFDRLAHNEEEDKGGVVVKITCEYKLSYKFLPNENALLFKKLIVGNKTIGEVRREVRKFFGKQNGRLKLIFTEQADVDITTVRGYFKNLHVDIEVKKIEKENILLEHNEIIDITKDNITSLLLEIDPSIDIKVLSKYL